MKFKCVVFDLDGTIYFGSQLADKANEVIKKAREISYNKVFFVTNNSAKTRFQVFNKLVKMGIDLKQKELITSSYAISKFLKENNYNEVYCISSKFLKEEIEQSGINTYSKTPQAVVVGYDPDFKLSDLNELLNIDTKSAVLIAANTEIKYPKENGYIVPGAGVIVSAVETLLEKRTEIIIGKPNTEMLKIMVSGLNINSNEILVIGDSYNSDIIMAKNYGAQGILITKEKRSDCICIEKLSDLLEMWND